jgi:hypothetical protein
MKLSSYSFKASHLKVRILWNWVFICHSYSLLLHIVSIRVGTISLNCYCGSTWLIFYRQIHIQCECPICSYAMEHWHQQLFRLLYTSVRLLCVGCSLHRCYAGCETPRQKETHSWKAVDKSSVGYQKFCGSSWSVRDFLYLRYIAYRTQDATGVWPLPVIKWRRCTLDSYCVWNSFIPPPQHNGQYVHPIYSSFLTSWSRQHVHSPASVPTPASIYSLEHCVFNIVIYDRHVHF